MNKPHPALPPAPYGWDLVQKFGHNDDFDASETVPVWTPGTAYTWKAAAAASTIVSTDVNDTAAGTGMQTVTVQGVNDTGYLISETAALDGQTPVNLVNQYKRIFRMFGATAGSGGVNAGAIRASIGGTLTAEIQAGDGQTLMAIYTIPQNYEKAFLLRWSGSIGKATSATYCEFRVMLRRNGVLRIQSSDYAVTTGNSVIGKRYESPPSFQPGDDLYIETTDASASNLQISAGFDLVLYRRPDYDIP
jgi:hypothetical protein